METVRIAKRTETVLLWSFLRYLGGSFLTMISPSRREPAATCGNLSLGPISGVFSTIATERSFAIVSGFQCGTRSASVAQLAEQLICNQQVVGSSPSASSLCRRTIAASEYRHRSGNLSRWMEQYMKFAGGFPERSKGSDCKSDGNAFAGSNPAPPIGKIPNPKSQTPLFRRERLEFGICNLGFELAGVAQW